MFKVGDKVVPFAKSYNMNFEDWIYRTREKSDFLKKNGFLYVVGKTDRYLILATNTKTTLGDYFLPSEIKLYYENFALSLFLD